jgi:exonuclease SbcC
LEQQMAIVTRAEQIRTAAAAADQHAADIIRLDGVAEQYAAIDRQCRELEAKVVAWDRQHDTDVAKLEAEVDAAHRQSRSLGDAPCGDDLRPVCPLLAGAREAAGREQTAAASLLTLRGEQNPHADAWMGLMADRDALGYDPAAHAGARKALTEVQQDARLLPVLETAETRVAELKEQLEQLRTRHRSLDTEIAELKASRDRWAEAVGLAGHMRQSLETERAGLEIATREEADDRNRLARMQQALEEATAGEADARRRIAELTERREQLTDRLTALTTEVSDLRQRHGAIGIQLGQMDQVERELIRARAELDELRRDEATTREQLGRLRQDLAQVVEAEGQVRALQEEVAAAERQALVYEVLDQAAGKKAGVPALIVENAVPQIEALANDLLARMAGGRLAIRLDTQAEGKSTGTMQEVLRITVLDGGVDRPYQTYSGAERFMVDLALRIALSKFLAHRSGAEIKLLVLDEGIGCADASNRMAIMGALFEASKEFSKTLVVSHLAELQDAFPQRIEVTRTPAGSAIRVVA